MQAFFASLGFLFNCDPPHLQFSEEDIGVDHTFRWQHTSGFNVATGDHLRANAQWDGYIFIICCFASPLFHGWVLVPLRNLDVLPILLAKDIDDQAVSPEWGFFRLW